MTHEPDTDAAARPGAEPVDPEPGPYAKRFFALFGAGLIGVASLYFTMGPIAEEVARQPGAPDLPLPLLKLVLLINPVLLLLAGTAVGTGLAPKLGLRSRTAEWAGRGAPLLERLRPELPAAVLWGAATAVAMLFLDLAFEPFIADALGALEDAQPRTLAVTLAGILYGGITEEIVLRWGLVTLLAWGGWRIVQRGRGRPSTGILWTATVLAAVAFGAGHLGVVGAQVELTPLLVLRTVGINAVGGVVFGWLYWTRSLEAAMVAHAAGHVVFSVASWSGIFP